MPLSTIYNFQKSVGATVHMFGAIAKVTSLILTTHTILLEGGDSLVGSIHTRAIVGACWSNLQIAVFQFALPAPF